MIIAKVPPVTSLNNPVPLFDLAASYSTKIPNRQGTFDETDIYYPISSNNQVTFPIALMLPGALVDKADYSNYATIVARYGFVVVVPNHYRFVPSSGEKLAAEASQINDVLRFMRQENNNPNSPINQRIASAKTWVIRSFLRGAVGMITIANTCIPPFCTGNFIRPQELIAGAFYGTHRQDSQTEIVSTTNNEGIPIALIHGSLDGVATPEEVTNTFPSIQDSPKALITVEGANHYSITNTDNTRDSSRSILEQTLAIETIARWSALFLRAHLLNDAEAYNYIYITGDQLDKNVTVNRQFKDS